MYPRRFLPIIVAALLAVPAVAAAATPSPKDKADARTAVNDAKKAMKEQRYADAATALRRADQLDPSTATELDLAQALISAGKLVDAGKVLLPISDSTDQAFPAKKAREAAKKTLSELSPRIPVLKVVVTGPPPGTAKATLDGAPADLTSDTQADPGDHTVTVSADGFGTENKTVSLAEGEHAEVPVTLTANAPVAQVESSGSRLPGIIILSVGGAALVGGAVTGGLAFSATSDAKATCNKSGANCNADKVSQAKLLGNVSTGMFVAGGVVAATGIVLTILAPGGGSGKKDGARITPYVGAREAGVAGSF